MSIAAIIANARAAFTAYKSADKAQAVADANNAGADEGEVYAVIEKGSWFAVSFTIDGDFVGYL